MVWLVQNCLQINVCNSSKLQSPLGPLPGLCLGPAGDLKRSQDPLSTHALLTTNPGYAPGNDPKIINKICTPTFLGNRSKQEIQYLYNTRRGVTNMITILRILQMTEQVIAL